MAFFLKSLVRNNKKLSALSWAVRDLFGITRQSIHEKYFRKKTKHIIPDYLASHEVKKLQIGGGNNILKGWLNVNIYCGDRVDGKEEFQQAYMDATKVFPFADQTFSYIFSEHMIEHISYKDADFMIGECSRVLRRNGRIRIATPGYDNLVQIISNNPPEKVEAYFRKLIHGMYGSDIPMDPSYAVNYMFYSYGHRHVHSRASLSHLLRKHGFEGISFLNPQESQDLNFQNLEINHMHTGKDNNNLETLVAEATKSK